MTGKSRSLQTVGLKVWLASVLIKVFGENVGAKESGSLTGRALLLMLCLALAAAQHDAMARYGDTAGARPARLVQDSFPAPPADRTLIYWRAQPQGSDAPLAPLSVEAGTTPFRAEQVASSDKLSRLELNGEHAPTVIRSDEPHFYLFVPDAGSAHPPLLVRLTQKGGARRVSIMTQRGQRGFAIASEEIIKPHYRVLGRDGGMIYMEVWGREPLLPGEYAFIGSDMTRLATFSLQAMRAV